MPNLQRRRLLKELACLPTVAGLGIISPQRLLAASQTPDAFLPLPEGMRNWQNGIWLDLRALPQDTKITTALRQASREQPLVGYIQTSASYVPFSISGIGQQVIDPTPIAVLGGDKRDENPLTLLEVLTKNANLALDAANAHGTRIVISRPWAVLPHKWRTNAEIALLAEAFQKLRLALSSDDLLGGAATQFDILGQSSGAHLAIALAQETALVRNLVACAPPLSPIAWHEAMGRTADQYVLAQYDAVNHVGKLNARQVIIVFDPADEVVAPQAWRGWVALARQRGKAVAILPAVSDDPKHHALLGPGAKALVGLRKPRVK